MSATTVLTQDLYQGTVYGSPQPWQAGASRVTAGVLLSDEDVTSPANQMMLGLEVSFDGGRTYTRVASAGWVGSPPPPPPLSNFPTISVGYQGSQSPPNYVRVRVELPAPLSVGATLSFA